MWIRETLTTQERMDTRLMIQRMHPKPDPRRKGRRPSRSAWRHPSETGIEVPRKTAMALAIMGMGISDYAAIAQAAGLSWDQVAGIDLSDDRAVQRLGVVGIPYGHFFNLRNKIRCPLCEGWITVAPCVACDRRAAPSEGKE